jgi:hypothetical protein
MKRLSVARHRQRGAALILLMLVVIVAITATLVGDLNRNAVRLRQLTDTGRVLAAAKAALIDYATINTDLSAGGSLSLPCPDIDSTGGFADGEAHSSACGLQGVTVIGRLPWRTLGVEALKDASAACLWYVVSGSYKDAQVAAAPMINTDSNGQLQLFSVNTGALIAGISAEDRPVAVVIAAMRPINGQLRTSASAQSACAPGAVAPAYLDTDARSGISNSFVAGLPDGIDQFAASESANDDHNDQLITISREDIAMRVQRRADFEPGMRALGLAAAACLADYAANNPAGSDDKRLPWPAPLPLADYRPDDAYDDADTGFLSGRLPDIVDDSNASTSNTISRVLSDCNGVAVPQWTAARRSAWQNWKDHFFYAVADSYSPSAPIPSVCASCLTINGSGQYAALLIYSNVRLQALAQIRNASPFDADTKRDSSNYLEGFNASNIPGSGASTDYRSQVPTETFNDLLFCIDDQLVVSEC